MILRSKFYNNYIVVSLQQDKKFIEELNIAGNTSIDSDTNSIVSDIDSSYVPESEYKESTSASSNEDLVDINVYENTISEVNTSCKEEVRY